MFLHLPARTPRHVYQARLARGAHCSGEGASLREKQLHSHCTTYVPGGTALGPHFYQHIPWSYQSLRTTESPQKRQWTKEISFASRCSGTLGTSTFALISCILHTMPALQAWEGPATALQEGKQEGAVEEVPCRSECSPWFSGWARV